MYHIETLKRKNSKHYTKSKDIGETENDVIEYLKKFNLKANITNTPYFFTYIHVSDQSIITQSLRNFQLSPTHLLEVLRDNQNLIYTF
jgi:hypothetical protein